MAYIRGYLETCEGFGWEGGPEFSTRLVTMANGFERRNGDWVQPRRKYSIPFLNLSSERYEPILSMFLVAQGMLHCFLYRDPLDHSASSELVGFGDGVTDTFQLSKLYTIGGFSYQRNVYAIPDSETPTITVNGIPTSSFSIDRDRGLVIFDSPPGNALPIRWTGEFDVWVRFNQDYLPFSLDNPNARNGQVELIEMPPPAVQVS
jgi:uncharacterized protein (TIGR02217 family)